MHLSERLVRLIEPQPPISAVILHEHTKPPVPRGGCFGQVLLEGPGINVIMSIENRGKGKDQDKRV